MSDTECAKCKKSLAGGSILTALDKKWHAECFTCTGCKAQLANQSFHNREDGPYCSNCFKEKFQPKCDGMSCAKCNMKFTAGAILTALEKKWHPECFVCDNCRSQLANQMFHCKDDTPYCAKCWRDLFQPKCNTCKAIIEPNEQYMTYNDRSYHKNCFVCHHCKETLAGKQFCIKEGQYFCPDHV